MGQRVNGYCLNFNIKKVKIPLDNSMKTNFRKKGFRLITYDHRDLIVNLEGACSQSFMNKTNTDCEHQQLLVRAIV